MLFLFIVLFVFVISTKIIEYMCYQDERNIYIRNYMYIDSSVEDLRSYGTLLYCNARSVEIKNKIQV